MTALSLLLNLPYGGASDEKCFTVLKRVKNKSELSALLKTKDISVMKEKFKILTSYVFQT